MKKSAALLLGLALLAGCGKKQAEDGQAGATQSAFTDVMDSKNGYIVENARLATADDNNAFVITGGCKLAAGTSSVMIIRGEGGDPSSTTILALEFPSFAAGSSLEFDGTQSHAQFWVVGKQKENPTAMPSGLISGSLRFIKKNPSKINLGLGRDLIDGVGDIEVVVANISVPGVKMDAVKKYAARFNLPFITLEEMVKINQPA